MRTDPRPSNRVLYVLIALLMAMSVGVQAARDARWVPFVPPNPMLWMQSGDLAKRLSLGFENLVADAYWIRAVVYYGGRLRAQRAEQAAGQAESNHYELLYPLLDLVTTLDPHFRVAYRFGAIFLTEAYPAGPGRPDLAIKLLERGIERDNARWEYFHDAGFVNYWWVHDYAAAADWFLRASARPGAAEWLKPLAAATLTAGGQRETSRQLWAELANSDMGYIRSQAQRRLMQLDAMDTIARLTPILQRFIDREHRIPGSWEELARAERLPGVPTDPTGMRFVFDPKVGYIDVSPKSTLFPLPREENRGLSKP